MPSQLVFLPGASGNRAFWAPLAECLAHPAERVLMGWPGFGTLPADPQVRGIEDLVGQVVARLDRPTALIAQSMGGVVAVLAALQRPEQVTHLVLTVTSGGLDLQSLGAEDWRSEFSACYPQLPAWFCDYHDDLGAQLATLDIPTLLLWGDADPISPVRVGQRLQTLLPHAHLQVFAGGGHDLAQVMAAQVAPWVDGHLAG